jgi:hypothetical protein
MYQNRRRGISNTFAWHFSKLARSRKFDKENRRNVSHNDDVDSSSHELLCSVLYRFPSEIIKAVTASQPSFIVSFIVSIEQRVGFSEMKRLYTAT